MLVKNATIITGATTRKFVNNNFHFCYVHHYTSLSTTNSCQVHQCNYCHKKNCKYECIIIALPTSIFELRTIFPFQFDGDEAKG